MRINKNDIIDLLKTHTLEDAIKIIKRYNPRKVINPLISFLCHGDPDIRWKAIRCGGVVVSELASEDMESARIIMRRLMWHLNDESGGIGWGVPELMGEIMYLNKQLSEEFIKILISYIMPEGNYLETDSLRSGAIWAIGRVAQRDQESVKDAVPYLLDSIASESHQVKGTAIWTSGIMKIKEACPLIQEFINSDRIFQLYTDKGIEDFRIRDIARASLEMISC